MCKLPTRVFTKIDDWRLLICDCRSAESGSIQRLLPKSAIITRHSSIRKSIHEENVNCFPSIFNSRIRHNVSLSNVLPNSRQAALKRLILTMKDRNTNWTQQKLPYIRPSRIQHMFIWVDWRAFPRRLAVSAFRSLFCSKNGGIGRISTYGREFGSGGFSCPIATSVNTSIIN
jgi:hypothetical protein